MKAELADLPLPLDWELARISQKFDFTTKPKGVRLGEREAIPFVPMDLIPSNRLFLSDFVMKKPQKITSGTYFEEGDLLISKITPCFENGKQGIAKGIPGGFGIATTEVIPVKAIEGESYLPFLAMYLLHPDVRNRLAGRMEGATGRQRLPKSVLEEWSMPFPPLPEQRAIAGVLGKIQAGVEVQERIVATLKELKAATMAKLLREGLRGEPLKLTEIGEIPQSWEVVRLGNHCERPRYGYTESASSEPVGPKFLRITDITDYGVDWDAVPYCACPQEALNEFRLMAGDLVVARIGATTGKSYLVVECPEAVFASYLIRLRAEPSLDPAFLSCFFESEAYWGQVRASKGSNLKGGINASVLSKLLIPLPSSDEQKQIAATLKGIDRQITAVLNRRNVFKSVFSSMLHLLMTGQVRVTRRMIALQALADRAARRPKWSGKVDEKVLEEIVRRIVGEVAPEKIILFGSAARGEMGPDSDLDLLVVKACEDRREVARTIRRQLIGIGVPKDVVVVTPEDVEEYKDIPGYIIGPALKEGKVLYAA